MSSVSFTYRLPLVRRFAIFTIVAVIAIAAIPVACTTECCALSSDALRMMALMGCCDGTSTMHSDVTSPDAPAATLVSANQFSPRSDGAVVSITAAAVAPSQTTLSLFAASPPDLAGATPPIFLRDAQFRI